MHKLERFFPKANTSQRICHRNTLCNSMILLLLVINVNCSGRISYRIMSKNVPMRAVVSFVMSVMSTTAQNWGECRLVSPEKVTLRTKLCYKYRFTISCLEKINTQFVIIGIAYMQRRCSQPLYAIRFSLSFNTCGRRLINIDVSRFPSHLKAINPYYIPWRY